MLLLEHLFLSPHLCPLPVSEKEECLSGAQSQVTIQSQQKNALSTKAVSPTFTNANHRNTNLPVQTISLDVCSTEHRKFNSNSENQQCPGTYFTQQDTTQVSLM